MRAIDLYAGVGGWGLGLKLAGIDVVASYEWWPTATFTHSMNLGSHNNPVDIRQLELGSLPSQVDLVVGSPPCTQFSYSNRGGNGDLEDGLKDLVKFLEVVEHLKPKFWVLENVPRVAGVLEQGFSDPDHPLYRFRSLGGTIRVLDLSAFGLPQARKRCLAGNIPFELLEAYAAKAQVRTLGDVTSALAQDAVVSDPIWGVQLKTSELTEMETEAPLNGEELRMNREAKLYHPIYNNMAFPDQLDTPARTVTATCTRVSRESVVIPDPRTAGAFRRLSIRERASLQGFPITYQFYGASFSEKAKMVGNAIPPPFTYLVGMAVSGTAVEDLPPFEIAGQALKLPSKMPRITRPDTEGKSYPERRRFRSALPGLRFKSGMRFDLSNQFDGLEAAWAVRFYFGPSKDIREISLDADLWADLTNSQIVIGALRDLNHLFEAARIKLAELNGPQLQKVWTRRGPGLGPFEVTDLLGGLAEEVFQRLSEGALEAGSFAEFVLLVAGEGAPGEKVPGAQKLARNATRIVSGFVVGSWFNQLVRTEPMQAAA